MTTYATTMIKSSALLIVVGKWLPTEYEHHVPILNAHV